MHGSSADPAGLGFNTRPSQTRPTIQSGNAGENPAPRSTFPAAHHWRLSDRADKRALPLADRHYNRQKPGTPQFVPPGRCLVLLTPNADALWVTSWPFAEYTKHAWAGAWVCSCFRNESTTLSSTLIREAEAITRWFYGEPPDLGFVTFVDITKTRRKRDPGRCYRKAGWKPCGYTKGGLFALQHLPGAIPSPREPIGAQMSLAKSVDGS